MYLFRYCAYGIFCRKVVFGVIKPSYFTGEKWLVRIPDSHEILTLCVDLKYKFINFVDAVPVS